MSAADWRDAGALHTAFVNCEDEELGKRVSTALKVLSDAIRVFGPDAVYASFNGGKDAVVILHLLRAAAHGSVGRPHLVYFDTHDEFDEVREFVKETVGACSEFDVEDVERDVGFAEGLAAIVADRNPRPLAFVLGTRMGDPNCGDQQRFEPSSKWMPPFMRVNPILDWTYGDVWSFLRYFQLPYCCLYDQGYTSLGSTTNTYPNPALRIDDTAYLPAYELADFSLERAGRQESPKRSPKPQHNP